MVQDFGHFQPSDINKFSKFVDLCKQMVSTMRALKPDAYAQADVPMMLIRRKLPPKCLEDWGQETIRMKAYGIKTSGTQEVGDFLKWLSAYVSNLRLSQYFNPQPRSKLGEGPSNGGRSFGTGKTHKGTTHNENGSHRSNSLNTTRPLDNFATIAEALPILPQKRRGQSRPVCCFDGQPHESWDCRNPDTLNDPAESRRKAFEAGLCLNCLHAGHHSRDCKAPACPVDRCGRKHHRMLHYKQSKPRPKNMRR